VTLWPPNPWLPFAFSAACAGVIFYAIRTGRIPVHALHRSTQPKAFWVHVALFAIFGAGALAWAVWRVLWHSGT
jgi:hypothetical protein